MRGDRKMKVMVIGLGSMGKRRISLLKQLYSDVQITGIDVNEKRREQVKVQFDIDTSDNIVECCNQYKYDAAFICTSPISHALIIDTCLEYHLNVFTEINVIADDYDKLIQKAREKECTLFLSSTMLYRKEIQYINTKVKDHQKPINYIYHVGQYLPDWHPWEHFKDFFVSNKRTNGCRELFAIELPWIINTFGNLISMTVQKSKMSDLDIDYNDNYIVNLMHETGHKGVLMLDVVSRNPVRRIEIVGEEIHVVWEGTPQTLTEYDIHEKEVKRVTTYEEIDKNDNYSANIIENAYADEIKHFMNVLRKGVPLIYTFEKDKEILKIIDAIEK